MSRRTLWGIPPYAGWTAGPIRIEDGSRAAYDRRKAEGWTGLRILDAGQPYEGQPCAGCFRTSSHAPGCPTGANGTPDYR